MTDERLEAQRKYKRDYMRKRRREPKFIQREKFLREHSDVRLRNGSRNGRCFFCERPATTKATRMTLGKLDWEETEVPYCGVC